MWSRMRIYPFDHCSSIIVILLREYPLILEVIVVGTCVAVGAGLAVAINLDNTSIALDLSLKIYCIDRHRYVISYLLSIVTLRHLR